MLDHPGEEGPRASRRCWHNFGCPGTGPDCAPFETADEAAQRGWNEYHAIADPAYQQVKAAALDLAGWVQQFRRECEVPEGARDLMLRASIRQSMYDAADLLVDEFGRALDLGGEG